MSTKDEKINSYIYENILEIIKYTLRRKNGSSSGGDATLSKDLVSSVEIGSVKNGTTYIAGTELETVIRDILIEDLPPGISLTLTPATEFYDVVTETVSTIKLTAVVTKKTYTPTNIKFYVGTTEINSQNISGGGTYTFTYTPATPMKTDKTFKAVVTDGKLSNEAKKTIKFVGKTYYGIVASTVTAPTEDEVKALNFTLKDTKNFTYNNITTDFGKVVYAYPVSFGALTSIKDTVNNLTYTNSFEKTTATIDGISYNIYTQKDPSAASNVKLVFA